MKNSVRYGNMKYLLSGLLYIFGLSLFCAVAFMLFEGSALNLALVGCAVIWSLFYAYSDKIVLIYLNAREVIDTDRQELFQRIKNEVYKTGQSEPKVYIYSGRQGNCFVSESRGTWSIVLERGLLKQLSSDQLEALVNYLFKFRRMGNPLIQTKVMGLSSSIYITIYWLVRNALILASLLYISLCALAVREYEMYSSHIIEGILLVVVGISLIFSIHRNGGLLIKKENVFFRVFSLFLMGLFRPVFFLFDLVSKKTKRIDASLALQAVVNRSEKESHTFDQLLVDHFKDNFSVKNLIVEHLESYPVLENCYFEKN